jgi:hypothetical protein
LLFGVDAAHAVSFWRAQVWQIQARSRAAAGIVANNSALNATAVHQQAACGSPVAFAISMAQRLG